MDGSMDGCSYGWMMGRLMYAQIDTQVIGWMAEQIDLQIEGCMDGQTDW